jgi:hypothetical protein
MNKKDVSNLSHFTGEPLSPPPPKLTLAQMHLRWPDLFRDSITGRYKHSPLSKRAREVEHLRASGQPKFGIAGLNTRDTV